MNLKRFMLALAGVAMLAAVMTSSASAAVETGGTWYVEGVENEKGEPNFVGPESVACTIGKHEGEEKFALEGELTGFGPIVLTATGIECKREEEGELVEGATILNDGVGGQATDAGVLRFTEVTIDGEISTVCSVEEETVTTNNLASELYMDSENPEIAFDKFEPAEGKVNFAVIHIVGATCPIAGNRAVRGYVYGEAVNHTGEPSSTQPLTFSEKVDKTAGSNLKFAGNEAHLTGNVVNSLSGANAGKKFWAK